MVTFGLPRGARRVRAGAGALGVAAALALAGCGHDGPKLVRVSGKVYYQDKPYPKSSVWFAPEPPSGGMAAQATTDQDGAFTAATPGAGDGVVPGRYKVGIRFPSKGLQPPRELQKYATAKTTPLAVDVPVGGLTDYEIRLK